MFCFFVTAVAAAVLVVAVVVFVVVLHLYSSAQLGIFDMEKRYKKISIINGSAKRKDETWISNKSNKEE